MEKTGWKVLALILLTGYILAGLALIILAVMVAPLVQEVASGISDFTGAMPGGGGSGPGGGFPSEEQMKQMMEQGGRPGAGSAGGSGASGAGFDQFGPPGGTGEFGPTR